MTTFDGRQLTAARALAELTVAELADAAGVTVRTINRLEVGGLVDVAAKKRHGHVSQDVWTKIMNALAQYGVEPTLEGETHGAGARWKEPRAKDRRHDAGVEEALAIGPNTLVFYVDDTGDEIFGDPAHPVFAFGGVAYASGDHQYIGDAWRDMKRVRFPQVRGPLHAKRHLRREITRARQVAIARAMPAQRLGRFGTALTSRTSVALDDVVAVACGSLANRLERVASGMAERGLWNVRAEGARAIAIFEESARLVGHLERELDDLSISVAGRQLRVAGHFMRKAVATPFLEMADVIATTVGRNANFQLTHGPKACQPMFQLLFREVGPPLADYFLVQDVQKT